MQQRLKVPRDILFAKVEAHWRHVVDNPLKAQGSTFRIPKMLHQIWHHWPGGTSTPPTHLQHMIDKWRAIHPGWQHQLWDATEGRKLIATHYPHFLTVYDSYPDHVQRVDALRYFILHKFGGVYIDADIECLQPLDGLLSMVQDKAQLLLPLEPKEHSHAWCTTAMIGMSFIASIPMHSFWKQIHTELALRAHLPVLLSTGPLMVTSVVVKNIGEYWNSTPTLLMMPPSVIYPIHQYESSCNLIDPHLVESKRTNHTFAMEHWCGSWRAVAKNKV